MAKLVLVTAIYDLTKKHDNKRHRTVDAMLAHNWVLKQKHDLVVFTEPEIYGHLDERRVGLGRDETMKIDITLPLTKLVTEARAVSMRAGQLQDNTDRPDVFDRERRRSLDFIRLMWGKYTMLQRVINEALPHVTHVGWIDYSITHVAKPPPDDVDIFANPTDLPRVHMLRYFDAGGVVLPGYWRNVHGHLAGGLVVGGIEQMAKLCSQFLAVVDQALAAGFTPLDEGVLSYIASRRPQAFSYSHGDYCDILQNHDKVRGGHGHLRWQIDDAWLRGINHHIPGFGDTRNATVLPPQPGSQPVQAIEPITKPGLLGLVMIVKDEAHGLRATLESALPFIDYWTILDTGSTDGTQALIVDVLRNIPGDLLQGEFGDFSSARNLALDLHAQRTIFTLMLDSDDRVVNGETLRKDLQSSVASGAAELGFMLNIRRGNLDYWLPLVLRTSIRGRYKGKVHEFVDVPVTARIRGVEVVQDQPPQSAAASRRRYERDLRLLLAERVADPKNDRTVFYLAQTYECLSEPWRALITYEDRIEMGGWPGDTYEAKFRRAKIMNDQPYARWSDVQQAYLDAHAFDPSRAEPLWKIAQHYRALDNHALAFLFAHRAASLPVPNSDLYIDPDVYKYRAHADAGISGYYLKDAHARTAGADHVRSAVAGIPNNEGLRANWAFYAPTVAQKYGAISQEIPFHVDEPYICNNPSIHYDEGARKWRCVVRTTNYRLTDGHYNAPGGVINTRNYMLELAGRGPCDFDVARSVEMVDRTGIRRSTYPVHGFEDCRLFQWQGRLYCTATVCDLDLEKPADGPREIALMTLGDDYEVLAAEPLRGPWSPRAQKNWMPLSSDQTRAGSFMQSFMQFLYATDPNPIVLTKSAECGAAWVAGGTGAGGSAPPRARERWASGRLRGSSQLVCVSSPIHSPPAEPRSTRWPTSFINNSAWLAVVHDVAWTNGNRMYTHRFALFDEALEKLVGLSDPFVFEKLGIEFCAGLALGDGRLVASYGVDDTTANLAVFDLDKVLASIRTDYVI